MCGYQEALGRKAPMPFAIPSLANGNLNRGLSGELLEIGLRTYGSCAF